MTRPGSVAARLESLEARRKPATGGRSKQERDEAVSRFLGSYTAGDDLPAFGSDDYSDSRRAAVAAALRADQ